MWPPFSSQVPHTLSFHWIVSALRLGFAPVNRWRFVRECPAWWHSMKTLHHPSPIFLTPQYNCGTDLCEFSKLSLIRTMRPRGWNETERKEEERTPLATLPSQRVIESAFGCRILDWFQFRKYQRRCQRHKARGAVAFGMQALNSRNRKFSNRPPDGLTFQNHFIESGFRPVNFAKNDLEIMIQKGTDFLIEGYQ